MIQNLFILDNRLISSVDGEKFSDHRRRQCRLLFGTSAAAAVIDVDLS